MCISVSCIIYERNYNIFMNSDKYTIIPMLFTISHAEAHTLSWKRREIPIVIFRGAILKFGIMEFLNFVHQLVFRKNTPFQKLPYSACFISCGNVKTEIYKCSKNLRGVLKMWKNWSCVNIWMNKWTNKSINYE
jgi:hypothetical protein